MTMRARATRNDAQNDNRRRKRLKELQRIPLKQKIRHQATRQNTSHEDVDETKRRTSVVTHCFNSGTCTPMIPGRLLLFYSPFSSLKKTTKRRERMRKKREKRETKKQTKKKTEDFNNYQRLHVLVYYYFYYRVKNHARHADASLSKLSSRSSYI